MSGVEKVQGEYGAGRQRSPFSRVFEFRPSQFILAVALFVAGAAGVVVLESTQLIIGGKNLTSIGILIAGLVCYSGVLVVVSMFRNETYLSIALLLPSIV